MLNKEANWSSETSIYISNYMALHPRRFWLFYSPP